MKTRETKTLHNFFEIGIFIKFINGIFEIIAGMILFFVSSKQIIAFFQMIFQHELTHDPGDFVASIIIGSVNHLSVKAKLFGVIYLIAHGIVNVGLFSLLSSRKLWAYPLAGFALIFIGLYEISIFFRTHSYVLFSLIIVDLIIILLLRFEYLRVIKLNRQKI